MARKVRHHSHKTKSKYHEYLGPSIIGGLIAWGFSGSFSLGIWVFIGVWVGNWVGREILAKN